ncbi:MAG: hypothetical protein HRU19_20995 [Pseudobacteriovorax sp.]|nr:hypothetical protein [Pseudobacteriovorax sp.]
MPLERKLLQLFLTLEGILTVEATSIQFQQERLSFQAVANSLAFAIDRDDENLEFRLTSGLESETGIVWRLMATPDYTE